jgi:mono/diheme cytochrome c family protein
MQKSRLFAIFLTLALACALPLAAQKKGGKKEDKAETTASAGDAEKGKAVFEQCSVCHNADNNEKKMGPGLKGLFKQEKMTNGKKPTEANVLAKVDEGGNGMPAYKEMLTDEEKKDLMAYLKTL